MSDFSQDPDPGSGTDVLRWNNQKVPNGGTFHGFLAGPVIGIHSHRVNFTKPCPARFSFGALTCPDCAAGRELGWKGYVPIYSELYQRTFVLISKDILSSVKEIELHAQVVATRAKSSKAPIEVRAKLWRTNPLPLTDGRRESVDLMPFLVGTLWGNPQIQAWYASKAINPKRKAPGKRTVPKPADDIPPSIAERMAYIDPPTPFLVGDTPVFEHLERVRKGEASANGTHKPTE